MRFLLLLGTFLVVSIAMFSPNLSAKAVENARYDVLARKGNIEHRTYPDAVYAEIIVKGGRKSSINEGFQQLYEFISGKNTAGKKIAMTAPVVQEYLGKQAGMNAWAVRFFMPNTYSMETLPKPSNPNIVVKNEKDVKLISLRFNGSFDTDNLEKHRKELEAYLEQENIEPFGEEMYAAYNAPWTPPFMRRNEVMYKVKP
jgi:hypothetical protein